MLRDGFYSVTLSGDPASYTGPPVVTDCKNVYSVTHIIRELSAE